MTIAYGHGLAVRSSSPRGWSASAAIVNGSIYRSPTLVRHELGNYVVGKRVISQETSTNMRRLMRLVVENGTGRAMLQHPAILLEVRLVLPKRWRGEDTKEKL